jgi:hypothetical protein
MDFFGVSVILYSTSSIFSAVLFVGSPLPFLRRNIFINDFKPKIMKIRTGSVGNVNRTSTLMKAVTSYYIRKKHVISIIQEWKGQRKM